jgi:hypothetical protein
LEELIMTEANGVDRTFSRLEAAAFLTDLGRKITPQRLATRAVEGLGPAFEKDGRNVVYKESVLRAWVDSPEVANKGGRGKKTKRNPSAALAARRVGDVLREAQQGDRDLRAVLKEHITLADALMSGQAGAMVGFQFARSVETLRKLVAS